MIDRLEHAEDILKDAMIPFLCAIFTQFHDQREIWTNLVSILTEIDCLISLSIASSQSELPMCRPKVISNDGEFANSSYFDIKSMIHPCVKL